MWKIRDRKRKKHMKSGNLSKFFRFLSILMGIAFCIVFLRDVISYDAAGEMSLNMLLAGRLFQFGLPGALAFYASIVAKKRENH